MIQIYIALTAFCMLAWQPTSSVTRSLYEFSNIKSVPLTEGGYLANLQERFERPLETVKKYCELSLFDFDNMSLH